MTTEPQEVLEGPFGPCVRGEHEDCAKDWVTVKGNIRYVCTCPCHRQEDSP